MQNVQRSSTSLLGYFSLKIKDPRALTVIRVGAVEHGARARWRGGHVGRGRRRNQLRAARLPVGERCSGTFSALIAFFFLEGLHGEDPRIVS